MFRVGQEFLIFSSRLRSKMSTTYNGITYAAAPPDGVARDVNPAYEATALIVVTAVTLPLATLFVGIRLYTRYFITASVGMDDCKCSRRCSCPETLLMLIIVLISCVVVMLGGLISCALMVGLCCHSKSRQYYEHRLHYLCFALNGNKTKM